MSKRWLGLVVVLAVVGWSRIASATLSISPTPVPIGNVNVATIGSLAATISESGGAETIASWDFTAVGCHDAGSNQLFDVVATLPLQVTNGSPKTVSVTFTPTATGAASCQIVGKDSGGASILTFTATGTGVAPTISVSPPGPVNMGSVRVANASTTTLTQVFTFSNTGNGTLSITDISFAGTNAGDFTLQTTPTFPINITTGTATVTVVFDPSASGARNATMNIASNDPATPTKAISLSGTGTNAMISVNDVAFGIVSDATTSNQNVSITNTGAAPKGPLTITSATISGGSFFSFGVGSGCNGGTSCTFTQPFVATSNTLLAPVRCSPPAGASGTQTATVTFVSDTDAGGTTISNLSCTAGRPNIMVDKTALAFGNQLVATGSAAQIVTITNTGNTNLTYSIAKSPNASQYAITGCVTACTVPGGMNATFSVVFTPTSPGELDITINITNNDPDPGDSPIAVAVTGKGVAPDISASPNPIAFGNIEVGMVSGMQVLTATNSGSSDLTISNAALTSGTTDYSILSGTTGPQMTVIPPGMTATWSIVCDPAQTGSRPGNFRITSNAFSGSTTNVSLTCTGQAGILTTTPTSIDFGGVAMGTSKTLSYTLNNTGNLPVTGITGVLDVTNVGYSLDPTTPIPAALNPGTNVTLKVIFAPMSGTDGGPAHVTFTGNWGSGPSTTTAVLDINGDGLTAGFDVTPPTVDFMDLRFDTTPTKTFCIVNTQQAAVTIFNNISISPHAGTMTNEFVITGVKRQTTCNVGGSAVALPQTLAQNDVLEVTVKADPANRIGAMAADLTVTSDLAMNPTRTILLKGNSTTAAITLSPGSTLDFGTVDVDTGPVTQTLAITNTGDGPLDLSAFTRSANSVFTLTLPSGTTTLQPTQHVDIAITYDPVVDRPAGQFDSIVITHGIAGVLNGPSLEMLQIQGRGIDRHIDAVAPTVPDAYRNPGNDAPVLQVPVMNTGEANLHVSAVMVAGDPVWTVVDPTPFDVAGGGNASVVVRFAPTDYGPAPTGMLTIMNNDDGHPMVVIELHGNGLNRTIDLGPNTIDFGYVGVGIPVTMDGALQVASMNAMRGFTISGIQLDGDADLFAIGGSPAGARIESLAMDTFPVTFTPQTEGDFHATALLFVEPDPVYQDKIDIVGHAVYVDAHGGGGCSAGGSAGVAMVIVIAFVVARRRRTALIALALAGGAARADNVDLTVFHPTPATTSDGFQLQSAEVGANGDWVALAVVSLATDPLVLTAYDLNDHGDLVFLNDQQAVQLRTQYEIGGAYAFLGRFEAGARMPLYTQTGQKIPKNMMLYGDPPPDGTARGDLTLHGKVRFLDSSLAALGAGLSLTLPTASAGQYTGVDKPSARLLGLATFTPTRRLTLTANVGAVIRARSTFANVDQRSGFAFGGGASFRLLDSVWFATELFGDMIPSGTHGTDAMKTVQTLSPVEWLAGFNYRIQPQWTVGLAVGRGVTNTFGSPAVRGVFELSFAPGARALAPLHPPVIDGDRDGDGIPDSVDKCPDEPEDKDMFEDQDGCPDPDNDHDGIPDDKDKCPLDPEDFDGFQDADGCPDKDNDGDGIPDALDKCPNEPEDKDGFEDLDGCPDPDNDHDGIPDEKDKCPNEPETINGYQDEDGCPDKGDPLVVISPDRLDTLEAVQWTGTKISRASFNLLGQIGAQLRAHTEIARLRITVHVQPTRDPDRDLDVSDKRAQAVRDWLVKWGIAATRLDARGFGGGKPLVPATQRGSFQMNERVELIILERK